MKANSLDRNEDGPAKGLFVEEVDLFIEELEDVIAPRLSANHNETMVSDSK